jgi:muramoyltetrapeptide carboxypeptidase
MSGTQITTRKPKALRKGSKIATFAPASPSDRMDLFAGIEELKRLGFDVEPPFEYDTEGYFAASAEERGEEFLASAQNPFVEGMIASRGGYGSNYLLESDLQSELPQPKCIVGFSDLTTFQIYLWQKAGWVTFHGPMVSAGFNNGANRVQGYDEDSFMNAVTNTASGLTVNLDGESLAAGEAEGRLLGGCLTLVQATIGTPWELDCADAILLLEDRGMKPYQVDRVLMHLKQAGKFRDVRGIVLGEFPDGAPSVEGSPTIREVCERILTPLGIPVVWGAPVGHTKRPMLTIPLGVRARLESDGPGLLDILEPAVVDD